MELALKQQIFIVETLCFVIQILRSSFSPVDLVFEILEHKAGVETHTPH